MDGIGEDMLLNEVQPEKNQDRKRTRVCKVILDKPEKDVCHLKKKKAKEAKTRSS